MKQPDMLDRYIAALRRDPTSPPPPNLDPAVVRAIRAMLLDASEAIPPVGARERVWGQVLRNAQSEKSTRDASRDPRPGSWMIHPNGKHKEENLMQTVITRPTILPRAPTRTVQTRFIRLAVAVIAVVLSAAILLPGLFRDTSPNGPAAVFISPQAINQATFERYINEAWNGGNTDVLPDLLTANHVCHEPGMPAVTGIDSMAAMIAHHHTAFSDIHFAIESLTATDDDVWARLTITGTHDGPFALSEDSAVDATGNTLTVEAMISARFADGKIAEQWIQSDSLGMFLQMGAMPTPEEALADSQQAIIEAQNRDVARRAVEAFGNPETPFDADDYYHSDATWGEGTVGPLAHTTEQRNDWVNNELWLAVPDIQIAIDQIITDGDLVIVEGIIRGRFEQDLLWVNNKRVPATGNMERWSWVWVYRFEDGKIAAEQWYWDWRSLYEKSYEN